jgi:PAS domain S-box-containing protein
MSAPLAQPPAASTRRQSVLVIDDHPSSLGGIFEYLRAQNLDVLIATSGEAGVERARYAQPDLILLDVRLPAIDGFETCRRLKANPETEAIPVIFMTIVSDSDEKVRGFAVGGVDYVTKPLAGEEVFARVNTHLRLRDLTRSLELRVAERTADLNAANAHLAQQIVERARVEAALRASEELHRVTLSSVSEAVLVTDDAGAFVYVSPSASAVFGYSADEIARRGSIAALLGGDVVDSQELCAQGEISNLEREIKHADGGVRVLLISVKRVEINRGTMLYTCRDISDHRLLEERLRETQRLEALGRLAGGIAHDFNNLLTVIISYCELLREQHAAGEIRIDDIAQIRATSERATSLVRQLLAFGRNQVLDLQLLDINAIVRSTAAMLERLLGPAILLNTALGQDARLVRGDASQIEQIIVNLAINARDAMPAGGALTIETAEVLLGESDARQYADVQPGPYTMLSVADTGVGMDEATMARMFEPFFTTKEPGNGTGLGLATVHGIVKQSGGHIWLDSQLGRGTVFRIYLPAARADGDAPELAPTPRSLRGRETVLVIEHEPVLRKLIHSALSAQGYRVLSADNVTALQRDAPPPDLLITGALQRSGGRALADTPLQQYPALRVLYISSYPGPAADRHGAHPAMTFLARPFSAQQLIMAVRSALDAAPDRPAPGPHPAREHSA